MIENEKKKNETQKKKKKKKIKDVMCKISFSLRVFDL